ncbi:fatty acid retinoid binding protein Gp-FAR-1 [Gelidibacter sediminis]|uniref:Fatty acid retinoid binding protein Gp-FAR-1 n=1 Tax=Gelidibacter sediminis TaxID=1608710 RepID=A0A4R7PYI4_9FLAO|nr:YtxH domain-containing protein [Gelidibacter sediminis]TDU40064.1 fatty acid retinoid binding protein Gp-FAR-1 [Gelidibacter sediminis]
MKRQQGKGLLALLGLGAGVFAWWKYKNLSPEQKNKLHSKVNDVGQKVKDTYTEVESSVKSNLDSLKNSAQNVKSDVKTDVNELANKS